MKIPPPTFGGLVKDYMQRPHDATNAVGIYARREADGKLLASSRTANVSCGVNWAVSLPMASSRSEGIVALVYGENATFSFLDGDVMWANLATVVADAPGYHRLDVTLGHDADGDGVADEYAEYMKLKMAEYGIAGEFDPDADYNRDGVTNREHYLAATNPFAGLAVGGAVISDGKCTIASMMDVKTAAGEDFFAITFNALEEVCYEVIAVDDLAKDWGEAVAVPTREVKDGGDEETQHWPETSGPMTLYVPKGTAKRRFFKLAVGSW